MSLREIPAPERGEDVDPSPLPRPPLDPEDREVPPRLRRQAASAPEPVAPPSRGPALAAPAPPGSGPPASALRPPAGVPAPEFTEAPPARRPASPRKEAAPVPAAPTRGGQDRKARRPPVSQVQVRRVRRVLRKIDTWSLFRFAVLLNVCTLVVCMAAFVGVWLVATGAGAIPSIENFITQLFALKKFHFKAFQLFAATLAIGIIGVFATTLVTVVAGVLYNLISDVVGGIEVTVLEEDPVRTSPGPRRDPAD